MNDTGNGRTKPRGDRVRPRYVFVGGYMHSGTTLIGEVVANLPGAHRPRGETKFLAHLPRYRALYRDLASPDRAAAFATLCHRLLTSGADSAYLDAPLAPERPVPRSRDHLGIFIEEVDLLLADKGATMLVEHTGTNVLAHQELTAQPGACMVEVVRDPRDVIASKKTRRASVFTDRYRPDEQRRKHLEKSFDPVWDTVSWRSFVRAGYAAAAALDDRHVRVRYEDLVADPEGVLADIDTVLGIGAAPPAVRVGTNNSADPDLRRAGVDSSSVGRWSEVLDPGEAALCSWVARSEMDALGYRSERVRPHRSLARPLAHAAIEPPTRVYRRVRLLGVSGGLSLVRSFGSSVLRRRPTEAR